MSFGSIKDAIWRTVEDVPTKHTLQMAAALSYYFVISLFPAFILVSAILAYLPGANPPSFDKQFVRDWLETTSWDKNSPPPELPPEVVERTRQKYREGLDRLTGTGRSSPALWGTP